jgi:hypothetical protein
LEKEARLVLNEILAKLNQNEKLIGVGAIVALVGFVIGLVLTSQSYGVAAFSVSVNWYSGSGAEGVGVIALILAIAAVVVVYLKYAPNMKIAWPAPLPLILLVITGVGGLFALLGLFDAFTFGGGYAGLDKPIMLLIAAVVVAVGCGIQVYGSYMEYSTNKTPAA